MLQIDLKYILVIEAARDIQKIIARSLEDMANRQVLLVNSIARGLALIQTQRPEVLLQTTACDRSIPIIFMAERIRSMDRLHFKQFGAVEAIAKTLK